LTPVREPPQYPGTGQGIDDHVGESEDLMAEESAGLDPALSVHAVATVAAREERKKLRRSVGRLDTAFLMLAAIIVLDTLGAVSSYGAQAFTWLVVMIIFFLVPYGLLTAELGSAFPEEGPLRLGQARLRQSRSGRGFGHVLGGQPHLAGRALTTCCEAQPAGRV
jgi:hypothetical protein